MKGPGRALEDSDSIDFPTIEAAFSYACEVARELMGCRKLLAEYWRLDVYDADDHPIFQIPLRTMDAAFVRALKQVLPKELHRAELPTNLLESADATMHESRALVAQARGKPCIATHFGQEPIRPVSDSAIGSVVGLAVSSCFSRGQMVPAEIVRPDTSLPVILLVEDEPLIRFSLAEFLRKAEFIVVEASTAREALTVLKVRPDVALVLADLKMPGALDGAGLIRQIRKSYPTVKVVVASAFKTAETVEASVAKPYSLERVLEVIKSVLAG
jgi:CheY-like chemotaxis protein